MFYGFRGCLLVSFLPPFLLTAFQKITQILLWLPLYGPYTWYIVSLLSNCGSGLDICNPRKVTPFSLPPESQTWVSQCMPFPGVAELVHQWAYDPICSNLGGLLRKKIPCFSERPRTGDLPLVNEMRIWILELCSSCLCHHGGRSWENYQRNTAGPSLAWCPC